MKLKQFSKSFLCKGNEKKYLRPKIMKLILRLTETFWPTARRYRVDVKIQPQTYTDVRVGLFELV